MAGREGFVVGCQSGWDKYTKEGGIGLNTTKILIIEFPFPGFCGTSGRTRLSVEVVVGEVPPRDGVFSKEPCGRVQARHPANAEWVRGSCCARSPTAKTRGWLVESVERRIDINRTRRNSVLATSIAFVILTLFAIVFGRTIG